MTVYRNAVGGAAKTTLAANLAGTLAAGGSKVPPPQHGLSSSKMALITLDRGKIRSMCIKWPESPRTVCHQVLLIDADPQCNLSSHFVENDAISVSSAAVILRHGLLCNHMARITSDVD